MTPFPVILFTTEKITGSTTETDKDAKKAQRIPPSCFFHFKFALHLQ